MKIYRLIVHHETPFEAFKWIQRKQIIAIGWGKVGDIIEKRYRDASEVGKAIKSKHPELNNSATGGPSLFRFAHAPNRGDLVILSAKGHRLAVVEIVGDYYYTTKEPPFSGNYRHQRDVRFVDDDPNELWAKCGKSVAEGNSIRQTFVECDKLSARAHSHAGWTS